MRSPPALTPPLARRCRCAPAEVLDETQLRIAALPRCEVLATQKEVRCAQHNKLRSAAIFHCTGAKLLILYPCKDLILALLANPNTAVVVYCRVVAVYSLPYS
jgi:hypothetical protein